MARWIPDPQVARNRYRVSLRTLDRWDQRPDLGFPPPQYINNRKYRDEDRLDAWDRSNAARVAGGNQTKDPVAP